MDTEPIVSDDEEAPDDANDGEKYPPEEVTSA